MLSRPKPPPRPSQRNQNSTDSRRSSHSSTPSGRDHSFKASSKSSGVQKNKQEPMKNLHPSWEAKRNAQKAIAKDGFKGTKIVFNDDSD